MTVNEVRNRTLYVGESGERSGIDVRYTKSRQSFHFGGWYDSFVGIEGGSIGLLEFLDAFGITAADVARAERKRGKEMKP